MNTSFKSKKSSEDSSGDIPKQKGGSSSNLKCQAQTCDVMLTIKRIRKGEKGYNVTKTDLDHLRAEHFSSYADFGWECSHKLREENTVLSKEIEKLQARVEKLNAHIGDPPIADPKNYVEGFCDALFVHPSGAVLKCTDAARYGTVRCMLHQKFPNGINGQKK